MSSKSGKGLADEYYSTPSWLVSDFMVAFESNETVNKIGIAFDPCCGGCDEYKPTYMTVLKERGFKNVFGIDIREDSHADKVTNYLELDIKVKTDLIISNPPFSLATKFIEKGLTEIDDSGYVIMLQRLNFVGSKKRQPFFNSVNLHAIYASHKRPQFGGINRGYVKGKIDPETGKPMKKKGADSVEYAHFVFKTGKQVKPTEFYII